MRSPRPRTDSDTARRGFRPFMRLLIGFAIVFAAIPSVAAQTRFDGLTEDEITGFLGALQAAVRSGKPAEVADLVVFPLRVNTPPKTGFVKTRSEFVRRYAEIFTPAVRAAILRQRPTELFRNWQGLMIGNGEIWFRGVCPDAGCSTHRVGVITVNVTT